MNGRTAFGWMLILILTTAPARADELMVDGRPADRVVVSPRADFEPVGLIEAPMARAVGGVHAVLEGEALKRWEAGLDAAPEDAMIEDAAPLCHVHVYAGEAHRRLAAVPLDGRRVVLLDADSADRAGPRYVVDRESLDALRQSGPAYLGPFELGRDAYPLRQTVRLSQPYVRSHVRLDEATLDKRLFRDKQNNISDTEVRLENERFHVRLPKGYDPRHPAGLLVWCSPTPGGRIPWMFERALDEFGFVAVGADNAGNDRTFNERAQIMLDLAATGQKRFHIDPRRVYITGMSGGGRTSGAMGICFPDIFRGSVPIVGLASYNRLRDVRAFFSKPRGELLAMARARPMALMSGPPDFNYAEMMDRMRRLRIDGFEHIRMFEYEDMAHVMPKPDRFLEALEWVDATYRETREAEVTRAEQLWNDYAASREDRMVETAEDRSALIEIVRAGPWTSPAWRALEKLRQALRDGSAPVASSG